MTNTKGSRENIGGTHTHAHTHKLKKRNKEEKKKKKKVKNDNFQILQENVISLVSNTLHSGPFQQYLNLLNILSK